MIKQSKPAIKSLGIIGSASALLTMAGSVSAILAWWEAIPDDLKQATIVFITVQGVQFVQTLIGLIGRWRAQVPIQGIFKQGK